MSFYYIPSLKIPTFDPQKAIDILYYSKASYCKLADIKQWTCVPCQQNKSMIQISTFTNEMKGIQSYIGYDNEKNQIVIAFRGSKDIQNWIYNLSFAFKNYSYCNQCKVHEGFLETLESIKDQMMQSFQQLISQYPQCKVLVTGHSLGAALSTLFSLEIKNFLIQNNLNNDLEILNFGSPRVGNQFFTNYFNLNIQNSLRIVNYEDLVPHLPPESIGFKHVNTEVWMLSNGATDQYKICPQQEDPTCSDSIIPSPVSGIEDHTNYFSMDTDC